MTRRKPAVDARPRSLHWDSFRSWVDPRTSPQWLFREPHTDLTANTPVDETVASRTWRGYFERGNTFLFEQYGVMLECPSGYGGAIMRGTSLTFCVTPPEKAIFTFPNVNARWMFKDDLCEVKALRHDVSPPQGMNLVADASFVTRDLKGGQPLLIPPYCAFGVQLFFKQGALDALWGAQQKSEQIKITYIMWGVLGEPNGGPAVVRN